MGKETRDRTGDGAKIQLVYLERRQEWSEHLVEVSKTVGMADVHDIFERNDPGMPDTSTLQPISFKQAVIGHTRIDRTSERLFNGFLITFDLG